MCAGDKISHLLGGWLANHMHIMSVALIHAQYIFLESSRPDTRSSSLIALLFFTSVIKPTVALRVSPATRGLVDYRWLHISFKPVSVMPEFHSAGDNLPSAASIIVYELAFD